MKRSKHIIYKKKQKKTKKIIKHTKKIKNTRKYYAGTILGTGKDGCIIDSISCEELSKNNNYVAKFLYNDKKINMKLNERLQRLDPHNERYNFYYLPDLTNCQTNENFDNDFSECSKNGKISRSNLVFQKKLEPIDEKKLTKDQYRYLRISLNNLHKNDISHGDLPGNIMLDPYSNMPIIIDWEEAKTNADDIDKQIDQEAFINNFKVLK